MLVKVGDTIFDGNKQPVMVILSPEDKKNIADMPQNNKHYCSFPKSFDKTEIRKWMGKCDCGCKNKPKRKV